MWLFQPHKCAGFGQPRPGASLRHSTALILALQPSRQQPSSRPAALGAATEEPRIDQPWHDQLGRRACCSTVPAHMYNKETSTCGHNHTHTHTAKARNSNACSRQPQTPPSILPSLREGRPGPSISQQASTWTSPHLIPPWPM
jgi:hypothetical protein